MSATAIVLASGEKETIVIGLSDFCKATFFGGFSIALISDIYPSYDEQQIN